MSDLSRGQPWEHQLPNCLSMRNGKPRRTSLIHKLEEQMVRSERVPSDVIDMLRQRGGRVHTRNMVEFRKLLPGKHYRLDAVVDALRHCRNRGMIKLKTVNGVTQVTLKPAWR